MLINSDWVAYLGAFKFPFGQPASRRVYGNVRSLANRGNQIVVGSGDPPHLIPLSINETDGQGSISYLGLGELPPTNAGVLARRHQLYINLGERTVRWLEKQKMKPFCVILYQGHAVFMMRLLHWCHKNHVPLISDVVEWYDPWHVQGGPLGPLNLSAQAALRYLYPKSDGIIAISSYLAQYYKNRGCRVLRVPPTLDVRNIEAKVSTSSRSKAYLTLAYTGVPGKKDLVNIVIEAILRLDPKGKMIRLEVAGPNADRILHLPALKSGGYTKLPDWLAVLGQLPYEKALNLVRNADFMPLIRRPLRYAQAGFPTKIPESLALGTPVICNITSDLGDYIHDGREGIICRDHSVEAFTETLERALSLTPRQRSEMRQAARAQAERSFDYRVYSEALAGFLEEVRLCAQ